MAAPSNIASQTAQGIGVVGFQTLLGHQKIHHVTHRLFHGRSQFLAVRQHHKVIGSQGSRGGNAHALFYGHPDVGVRRALGAGPGHRPISDHRVAIPQGQHAAWNEHGEIHGAARHQLLHVDVPTVGAAIAGGVLRVDRGGRRQSHGRNQGQAQAAGQHQLAAVKGHYRGIGLRKIFFQEAAARHHHVGWAFFGSDANEVHFQGVAGLGLIDPNRTGSRTFQRLGLQYLRVPYSLKGVPGFHHQLFSGVDGNRWFPLRVQNVYALFPA